MKSTRRNFIKKTALVSVGFSFLSTTLIACAKTEGKNGAAMPAKVLANKDQIDAWLQVLEDGRIRVLTGRMELGQGVRIAMMQVAAEELNTTLDQIEVRLAETGVTPDEGYTAGSRSMEQGAMSVRYAAATAREVLLVEAAKKLGVDKETLRIENGRIVTSEKEMTFSEVLEGKQLNTTLDESVALWGKTKRKWVGQPIPRQDISDMVQGKPLYVQDLRFPDMVHARIVRPPSYTAKLTNFNKKSLENISGHLKTVVIGSFIGVIASEEFQAITLMEKASTLAKWSATSELPNSASLQEHLKTLKTDTAVEEDSGNWQDAIEASEIIHEAEYFKPYIMHAANGPSCAVARFTDETLEVWSHTQGVYPLQKTLASLLELPITNIRVKGVPGSGCYGHNGADDVAAEAALLAKNYPNQYIRLQWMREDEHAWEPYGTAMLMKLKAGIDNNGRITGWKYDFWSDGHSTRPRGNPDNLLPARYLNAGYAAPGSGFKGGAVRNSKPYYELPNLHSTSHIFKGPLRVSALRGLGAYANIFAIECFMDELAVKAEKDPIQFRLNHLNDPRSIACLQKLREFTKGLTKSTTEGIGYAYSRYKNSAAHCAVAAHVNVDRTSGKVNVIKMWAVIDAGECINLDGLINQTEGGMIQSASWALLEEVKFDENHITSTDWDHYPIFRFPDTPKTEVVVIDRPEESPLGAGEAAQGPATAAVVNALFDATGIRVRELPVDKTLFIK